MPPDNRSLSEILLWAGAAGTVTATLVATIFQLLNGRWERNAANLRHKQELESEELRHTQSLTAEQRKLDATLESERRQQAQSLAVQLALEKWKIDHALAVKDRHAKIGEDPLDDLECLDVTVRRMIILTEAISGKKQ